MTQEKAHDIEMEACQLGMDAETFKRTKFGQFLLDRATMEAETLMVDLVSVEPDDIKENTRIRNKIQVCLMFEGWIDEVIESGRLAYDVVAMRDAMD